MRDTTPDPEAVDALAEFFEKMERVAVNLTRTTALTLDEARRLVWAEVLEDSRS